MDQIPEKPARRQSDAEVASSIRWVARAMDHDRRWLRPLRHRTRLPTGRRLAMAMVLVAASLGVGMFARMRSDADAPALLIAAFEYEGAVSSRSVAGDLRARLVNHIASTTSLRVSQSPTALGTDVTRAGGRLIERGGLLTLHLRVQEMPGERVLATAVLAGDVRALDLLVDEASREIIRHVARTSRRTP